MEIAGELSRVVVAEVAGAGDGGWFGARFVSGAKRELERGDEDFTRKKRHALGALRHYRRAWGLGQVVMWLWGLEPDLQGEREERWYRVHGDHLGSPLILTDLEGTVVWQGRYLPFGAAEVAEDPDGDGRRVEMNIRFPGQYYDSETGLHYNYHRYYDPKTGRYLRPDPIGLAGGGNPYAYVQNDPVNLIDPFGLKEFEMRIWIGGSVGYAIVGGGVYDVTIRDLETGQTTLYTMKVLGLGVGLPSFRGSSRPIEFSVEDPCKTSASFEGYGYMGGVSAEVVGGVKVGGGIKIPHGPFIPGPMIGWERGGVDIGVSHSITYWSH